MIPEKTVLLVPDGLLDTEAIKTLINEIALSRMPFAVIDCSRISFLLAEAVKTLREELEHFSGGYVEIEFRNLRAEMVLQFQLYDFSVEEGRVRAWTEETYEKESSAASASTGGFPIICRQCRQLLHVQSRGLHACPGCGSKLYVDSCGRTKYYEPLRLFQR